MKKTTTIHIGRALFHIEDDAYARLDEYLSSVQRHFAAEPDVLEDIESRIAERFAAGGAGVVTMADVDAVIEAMGTVDQFDESAEGAPETAKVGAKRLFRDPEGAVIAGVASGLGRYFGVDPIIFRIVFIAIVFLGGSGILLYIILWLVIPEAKTAAERLSMQGDPVTLKTVSESLRQKVEETKQANGFKKTLRFPIMVLRKLAEFIQRVLFPSVRVLVGSFLALFGFVAAAGMTVGLGMALFGVPAWMVDEPLMELVRGAAWYLTVAGVYLALLVPAVAVFFSGLALIMKKRLIRRRIGLSLLAFWFIGIVASGIGIARIAIRGQEIAVTDERYSIAHVTMPAEPFTRLEAGSSGRERIILVEGAMPGITLEGRPRDIQNVTISNTGGTLALGVKSAQRRCIFCDRTSRVTITMTVSKLSAIALQNGATIEGALAGTDLSMSLKGASRANLTVAAENVDVNLADASLLTLAGAARTAVATVSGASRYNAEAFETDDTTVLLSEAARASVWAARTLSVTASDASVVRYAGSPAVTKQVRDAARVYDAAHGPRD